MAAGGRHREVEDLIVAHHPCGARTLTTVYDYTHELNPASVSSALGAGAAGHSDKAFAAMEPVRFWIDLCCAHQKPALTSEALETVWKTLAETPAELMPPKPSRNNQLSSVLEDMVWCQV